MAPAAASKDQAADAIDVKCNTDHQPAVYMKAAKRFKQIINDWKERDEAIPIKCWMVLPSPLNRLGINLNMMYVHQDLGPNIHKKGFDPSRPKPGVVVNRSNPEKIKKMKEHAMKMFNGAAGLYPPLNLASSEVHYECVGGNHLTIVFRLYQAGMTSPLNGIHYVVSDDEPELRDKVELGHNYLVLKDGIPDDDLVFLSEYLNSDQNQNQCTSEVSTLAATAKIVKAELKVTPHPKVSAVITKVTSESLVRLKPDSIGDFAHYCCNQSGTGYVDELIDWHCRNVNPKEISVSPRWYGDAAKTFGKVHPLMLMGLTFVQYRADQKLEQVRPLPDISRAIGLPQMNALVKEGVALAAAEEVARDNRKMFEEEFKKLLGANSSSNALFNMFEEALARLLLSMNLGGLKFHHTVSGKFSKEKAVSLQSAWLRHVEEQHDEMKGIMDRFGISAEADDAEPKVAEEVHVCGHMLLLTLVHRNRWINVKLMCFVCPHTCFHRCWFLETSRSTKW